MSIASISDVKTAAAAILTAVQTIQTNTDSLLAAMPLLGNSLSATFSNRQGVLDLEAAVRALRGQQDLCFRLAADVAQRGAALPNS